MTNTKEKIAEKTAKETTTEKTTTKEIVANATSFVRETTVESLDEKLKALNKLCFAYGAILIDGNTKEVLAKQSELNKSLEEYNEYRTRYEYENIMEESDPMLSALKTGYITLKVVKQKQELGLPVVYLEDRVVQIDFEAFSSFARIPLLGRAVVAKCQRVGYFAMLLKGSSIGKTIGEINKAFSSSDKRVVAEKLESAPSMNQFKNALQSLIDEIYFADNGKGKNKFMCSSHWAQFFLDLVMSAKYGKGVLAYNTAAVKKILQTACGLYHAFLNEYGVTVTVDGKSC